MSVIAIASLLVTQAPITLNYQPKVGTTYKYANTTVQANPMTGGNQTISSTSTMKVLSFAGGYYKVDVGTSNVKVTGGGSNSEQVKKAMEGQHQTISFDRFGTPKVDGKGMNAGMQQMMQSLSGNGTGVVFPKKPVRVGETWSNTIDLGKLMAGAMKASGGKAPAVKGSGKITMTYKLAKVDGSNATITMTLKGAMDMDMGGMRSGAPTGAGQGMKMSMTFSGGGPMVVERSTGALVSSSTKMNMGVMGQNMAMSSTVKRL